MKTLEERLTSIIKHSVKHKRPLVDGECQSSQRQRCALCHAVDLAYDTEVTLKNEAVRAHWEQRLPPGALSDLVQSPRGRGYRTVTKRRAFHSRGSVKLGLISPSEDGEYKPFDAVRCAIEPPAHALIFRQVQEILLKPYAQALAEGLRYVIIKGNYEEYTLIVTVGKISANTIRSMNTLSKSLTLSHSEIVGVFLYEDKSNGRYYLPHSDGQQTSLKKIHGNAEIFQRICGKSFLYPPLSFSQINLSIVERFVATARALLDPDPQCRLIDLYSGYGLFGVCLAGEVSSVVGVDVSADSIEAATGNARRNGIANTRFIRSSITIDSLHRAMKSSRGNDLVLLDPPRNGTDPGVIEYIAARKPLRVLHIFCNIDIMPDELKRWTDSGFAIAKAVPLDMFPGTSSIEMMVLLTKH